MTTCILVIVAKLVLGCEAAPRPSAAEAVGILTAAHSLQDRTGVVTGDGPQWITAQASTDTRPAERPARRLDGTSVDQPVQTYSAVPTFGYYPPYYLNSIPAPVFAPDPPVHGAWVDASTTR